MAIMKLPEVGLGIGLDRAAREALEILALTRKTFAVGGVMFMFNGTPAVVLPGDTEAVVCDRYWDSRRVLQAGGL